MPTLGLVAVAREHLTGEIVFARGERDAALARVRSAAALEMRSTTTSRRRGRCRRATCCVPGATSSWRRRGCDAVTENCDLSTPRSVLCWSPRMIFSRRKRLRQIAGVLETTSFLSLKLLWKRSDRARLFPGIVFREYMALVGRERWRSQDIFELFPELGSQPQRIVLEHLPGHGVQDRIDALAYLALICVAIRPKTIFEFGTFRGRTALNFALNSPGGCRIFTLDIPERDRPDRIARGNEADGWLMSQSNTGVDYQGRNEACKIEQLFGDSTRFDFRPFYGQIDLVFVDGGHDYEVARSDTRNALEMLSPGGVVIWDEFANYGDYHDVMRAVLDELPADRIVQLSNSQLAVYRNTA